MHGCTAIESCSMARSYRSEGGYESQGKLLDLSLMTCLAHICCTSNRKFSCDEAKINAIHLCIVMSCIAKKPIFMLLVLFMPSIVLQLCG